MKHTSDIMILHIKMPFFERHFYMFGKKFLSNAEGEFSNVSNLLS